MSKIRRTGVITAFIALTAAPIVTTADDETKAPAQSSYALKSYTPGSAGAPGASDNFNSNGTLGQSTPIGTGSTGNHAL